MRRLAVAKCEGKVSAMLARCRCAPATPFTIFIFVIQSTVSISHTQRYPRYHVICFVSLKNSLAFSIVILLFNRFVSYHQPTKRQRICKTITGTQFLKTHIMSSINTKSEKMKLAPIRSFNDFLLDSKKYTPPAFNDLKRLNNRVTSNLLYYQTNYFGISIVVFLLFL